MLQQSYPRIQANTPSVVDLSGAFKKGAVPSPLFVIPSLDGSTFLPRVLAASIASIRPYFDGLRFPGLQPGEAPLASVEALADYCMGKIRAMQPQGPYHLCGHSFGGMVAYEMACKLREAGVPVDTLIMWDSSSCQRIPLVKRPVPEIISEFVLRLKRRNGHARRQFLATVIKNQWSVGVSHLQGKFRRIAPKSTAISGLPSHGTKVVHEASVRAWDAWTPRPYPGDALYFRATEIGGLFNRPAYVEEGGGWRPLIKGGLEVNVIPGTHLDMFEEPAIHLVAEKTATWLRNRVSAT